MFMSHISVLDVSVLSINHAMDGGITLAVVKVNTDTLRDILYCQATEPRAQSDKHEMWGTWIPSQGCCPVSYWHRREANISREEQNTLQASCRVQRSPCSGTCFLVINGWMCNSLLIPEGAVGSVAMRVGQPATLSLHHVNNGRPACACVNCCFYQKQRTLFSTSHWEIHGVVHNLALKA